MFHPSSIMSTVQLSSQSLSLSTNLFTMRNVLTQLNCLPLAFTYFTTYLLTFYLSIDVTCDM